MPTVDFPTISVTASRPGADPETMATTVAATLERRLGEIPGVTEMTSRSSLGSTRISIQFELSRSIDGAARDVQAAINAALTDLPGDLQSRPSFRKTNPASTPIAILALTSRTVQPSVIYDAADTVVAQRLSAPRRVRGQRQRRRAAGDPGARQSDRACLHRAQYGGRAHRDRELQCGGTARRVRRQTAALTIDINDQLRAASQYDPLVVRTASGTVVRLSAIASIEPSVRNSRSFGWYNGQPSSPPRHQQGGGLNVIETVDHIRASHPEIKRWIPADIDPRCSRIAPAPSPPASATCSSRCSRPSFSSCWWCSCSCAARRARGWRHGAARARRHLRDDVGGGIFHRQPFADGARGLGRLRGRRCHRDDRELFPKSRKGMSPMKAALEGARQIRFTVISISLSLVAAFTPLLFMTGLVGRVFREFSVPSPSRSRSRPSSR
jgi:multidrug efflux pump